MPPAIIVVGRIATLAGASGFGWVDAIAIADGRVVAAGSNAEIEALARPGTRRHDLAPDEIAMPGLTDAHLHLADAAVAAVQLDLDGAATLADGLTLVRAANDSLADPGAWLRGGGWDAGRWGGWPTSADLEAVAPGRRVLLWSHDLHAVWVSAAAMEAGGVTSTTPNPPGGVIRRLVDGAPAGVLHEDATQLVTAGAPVVSGPALDDLIERYARKLLAYGVVAAHDPSELETDATLERGFASIARLAQSGRLPIRVHAGIRRGALDAAIAHGLRSGDPLGPADGKARVGWLKLFGDGTLGSRTAALLAPYEIDPSLGEPPGGPLGVLVTDPGEMVELAAKAAAAGITTQIHAIGDRALRSALDSLVPTAGRTALRPRVEHVQLADEADLPRFAAHGILASVQPADLEGDAWKARRAWGRRAGGSYPWRRLLDSGAGLAFGTDAPAAPTDSPWPAISLAVTRRASSWDPAEPAFGAQEAISLAEAFRAACLGAAQAAAETDRGRLVAGHRADVVVIPAAGLTDLEALRATAPRLVLVDGVVVHGG